ncbi:MAG: primosomal protein N', partial [Lachnospiraceae bacterium]|nr:primosomal protein N' [Lachnospiraceae bacterium]
MAERYADIIIEISHEKVDRPFQYKIPQELADAVYPGVRVHVPFGRGNQDRLGYVVDISEETEYPKEKIKEITSVDEKSTTAESSQIQIAYWLKRQYGSTMITALKTVLPVKQKFKMPEKKKVTALINRAELPAVIEECERKHQTAKVRVLQALTENDVLPYELIRQKLNVSAATLQALEKQGYLRIDSEAYYRNPVRHVKAGDKRVTLSEMQ